MSKRRLSKQQSTRIQNRQQQYQIDPGIDETLLFVGLVITSHGRRSLIETETGARVRCAIRQNMETLVAGDRVIWTMIGPEQGVVLRHYPRTSVLGRPDKHGKLRPVAANISQLIIVTAVKPEISWTLLDSYLVIAECLGIEPCIVLNKTDISCEPLKKELNHYQQLGYQLLFTNHLDGEMKALQKACDHQTSVFVGQSGVGKSSLIARLIPEQSAQIQTADISLNSELGCHTTTNSQLYHLPTGGALIDSPGVREFGLWHMPAHDILKGFREFQPYTNQCKFRNCNHHHTPGCALQEAIKKNLVSHKRYENYVKISTQFAK